MPVDAVSLTIADLPALLCGPVLRRLTRTSITVWAALSLSDTVTLHVRERGNPSSEQTASKTPVRVGVSLWMTAITLNFPNAGFTSGTTYEYWLEGIAWPTGRAPDWSNYSFGEGPDALPEFKGLANSVTDFRITHASCRKPHGKGLDGLAALTREIKSDPTLRPDILLLSGDQIYADDVAGTLIPRLKRITTDLLGIEETDEFQTPLPGIDGRTDLTHEAGLTSGAAKNHLWRFGEFVAMYLLAWSPALWPADLPNWPSAGNPSDNTLNINEPLELAENSGHNAESWAALNSEVQNYRAALPDIAKLLANVPSLMIFDDHEVTDDWNLDHDWAEAVYGNSTGKRIMTNGLAAYLLCQHWGNKPDRFETPGTPEQLALEALTWNNPGDSPDMSILQTALGIPDTVPAVGQAFRDITTGDPIRYDFTFGAGDGYPFTIVALDGRTARHFPTTSGSVGRISPAALDVMLPQPPPQVQSPTLIIAPAPILGLHLLEHYIQPAGAVTGNSAGVDYEAWTAFGDGFEHLLQRVAEYQKVAIVSGDVHYGFSKRMEYQRENGSISRAAQLTSSGSKNTDVLVITLHLLGDLLQKLNIIRNRQFSGYANELTDTQKNSLLLPPPPGTMLPYDDIADITLGRVFREGQNEHPVFSTDVAQAYSLGNPQWQYSIEHIDDERLPNSGPLRQAIEQVQERQNWTTWNPDASAEMLKGQRAANLVRIGHVIAGLPQFAHIRFIETSGQLSVEQRLCMSVGGNPNDTHTSYTVTEIHLD